MAGIVWRGRETHNHQQGPVRWKQHPVDCSLFVLVGRLWLRDYPLPTLGELMRAYLLKQRFGPYPADRPDEARLAPRQVVQTTLAGFAEMDRLLDRAEQLISHQRPRYAPQSMLTSPNGPVS